MASEVSLGKLWIRFGIDNTDLEKGKQQTERQFKDLERRTQQFQTKVTQTIGRVAPWLTLSGVIVGVGRALQSISQDAKALEDLRMQSGLSVRSLFELREMVNSTGGSMQDLTTAVGAFNTAILTASRDSRSEAAQAFRELGVSIHDANGNLTTLDQATEQMASRFARWTDGANEAAIASTVFGGGAAAMLRALNQGAEGIRRAREQAAQYGQSVEEVHRQQLEWVNKTNALSTSMTHFRDQALTPMIPFIIQVVDWFSKLARWTRETNEAFTKMSREMQNDPYSRVVRQIQEFTLRIAEARAQQELMAQGASDAGGAFVAAQTRVKMLTRDIAEYEQKLRELEVTRKAMAKAMPIPPWQTTTTPENNQPGRTQTGLTPDQQRQMQAMLAQVSSLQQQLDGLPTSFSYIAEINRNTYQQMQDTVTATMEVINAKYKDQEDVVRNLHNLKMQLYKQEQDTAMQTANMVGTAISAVFSKSKGAAMAETIIHTSTAVMRALRDIPWPYNLVQAAAVAAQGAAQLAKIRSTTEKGGGSLSGSAGGGGAGSQAARPAQSVHISGVDPGHYYSGTTIERLIGDINNAVKNGATLITTSNLAV